MAIIHLDKERTRSYDAWYRVARFSPSLRHVMTARLNALAIDREICLRRGIEGYQVYDIKIQRIKETLNSLQEGDRLDIVRDYVA